MADIAANAESGYYRSDGIQNSDTALRYGDVNAEIYSGNKKIYPRQVTEIMTDANWNLDFDKFDLKTVRQSNDWKDGCKQGYYWQPNKEAAEGHWAFGKIKQTKRSYIFY